MLCIHLNLNIFNVPKFNMPNSAAKFYVQNSCVEVLCIWNAAPHNCSRRDPSQCCSSKHAGYDCMRHHLLGVVLIEDRQVVVGAAVKEWANVCVCCESMRFQSNKPTQSWCMHPKQNLKSKSPIRFKYFYFLFKSWELIRCGTERLKTMLASPVATLRTH